MHIVHVDMQVKPEFLHPFRDATVENASNSIQEPGIVRFDLLQDNDAEGHFRLVEVYRTPADADLHKQTAHYQKWRDTVAEMMLTARTSVKFMNIYPEDSGWV